MYTKEHSRRFYIVITVFLTFFICIIARLFFIHIFRGQYLSNLAKKQHNSYIELEPQRGNIYDLRMRPMAINIAMDSLYAVPNRIKDKQAVATQLSEILKLDYTYVFERLNRNKSFVWIARKISPRQSELIKNLKIKQLGFIKESKRAYPNGYMAGHVIGLVGIDNQGLEGVELVNEAYLHGTPGWATFLRDARQNKLNLYQEMLPPKDGLDIVLTIDEVVQYITERELDRALSNYSANAATVIVMDPHTGRILALANRPTYDLNNYSTVSMNTRRDRAICDLFEPGSVFKIVTASAAIEEKRVSENDRFFCENGQYRVANHILHDHTKHGWLTFREVVEQSSNIGTTKVAQMLGPDIVYRYAKAFGFGQAAGIDLPGEINGMLKPPREWSKTSIGAVPIGQEVGVNALQLVCAVSVIANGGDLMKPYVVERIQDKQAVVIKGNTPTVKRKVISRDTAERMKLMLKGVVENGTGKLAKPPSFTAAGKTGTAQKLEPDGKYSHRKYVASFIGFAPAEDPVVAIAVVFDEPYPYYFGGVVAAPVFKNIAEDVVKYLMAKPLIEEKLVKLE